MSEEKPITLEDIYQNISCGFLLLFAFIAFIAVIDSCGDKEKFDKFAEQLTTLQTQCAEAHNE